MTNLAMQLCSVILLLLLVQVYADKDMDQRDMYLMGYEDNAVTLQFYRCNLAEWSGKESDFQEIVAFGVNQYCSAMPAMCCLHSWNNRTALSSRFVLISPEFPQEQYGFLQVKFVVLYNPLGLGDFIQDDHCNFVPRILRKRILEKIVTTIEEKLAAELNWVMLDPPHEKETVQALMDLILLPVGLVGLILVCVVVKKVPEWQRNQDHEDYAKRRRKRMEQQAHSRHKRISALQYKFDAAAAQLSSVFVVTGGDSHGLAKEEKAQLVDSEELSDEQESTGFSRDGSTEPILSTEQLVTAIVLDKLKGTSPMKVSKQPTPPVPKSDKPEPRRATVVKSSTESPNSSASTVLTTVSTMPPAADVRKGSVTRLPGSATSAESRASRHLP